MKARWLGPGLALLIGGCGRYFAGPITPQAAQSEWMTVNDDGTAVTVGSPETIELTVNVSVPVLLTCSCSVSGKPTKTT